MPTRNKPAIIACVVLLALILNACSPKTDNSSSSSQSVAASNSSNNQFEPSGSLTFVPALKIFDGYDNGKTFYQIVPRAENASNNIYYTDFASKVEKILCSAPRCEHDDETCTGWEPYGAGGTISLPINDKLYIVNFGNTAVVETLGKDAHASIVQRDLDGTNRKLLHRFTSTDRIWQGLAYDNEYLYFMKDSFEKIDEENPAPKRELCAFDLESGELFILENVEYMAEIVGAYDDKIVIKYAEGEAVITTNLVELTKQIKTYSLKEKTSEVVFEMPYPDVGVVHNNYYYRFCSTTGSVFVYDLNRNDTEVEHKNVVDSNMLDENTMIEIFPVWDNKIGITIYSSSGNKQFAFDIVENSVREKKAFHVASSGKAFFYPIAAEIGDYLFVFTGYNEYDVTFQVGNGNEMVLPYGESVYSFISKDDYWNDVDNFIPIETI